MRPALIHTMHAAAAHPAASRLGDLAQAAGWRATHSGQPTCVRAVSLTDVTYLVAACMHVWCAPSRAPCWPGEPHSASLTASGSRIAAVCKMHGSQGGGGAAQAEKATS